MAYIPDIYTLKKKFLADLEAHPFKTLKDFSAEYGISARTLKIYAKESPVYWMRRMRHDNGKDNHAEFLAFYQEAPCLIEECLPEFGNPRIQTIKKTIKDQHIFDWGRLKVKEENLKLKHFEQNQINEKVTYLLGIMFMRTYIAIDQWDRKVVFLYFPEGMQQSRGLLTHIFHPKPTGLINKDPDIHNKIIIESDFLYDLMQEMRYDMMEKTLPTRIPDKFKDIFYRAIFDAAAQLITTDNENYSLRIYGNDQLLEQHLNKIYQSVMQDINHPIVEEDVVHCEDEDKIFIAWDSVNVIKEILQYIYKKDDLYFYNSRMRVEKNAFLNKNSDELGENNMDLLGDGNV